jgi:urea carboxylase
MLYQEPVFRPLGDVALGVEFGDELDLRLSFRVIALQQAIASEGLRGVLITVPTHRTLGIYYDPVQTTFEKLCGGLRRLCDELVDLTVLPSRRVSIQVWYDDPWSRECAAAHGAPNNLRYLAEVNGTTVAEIVRRHSESEHWVSSVGFQPGTYQAMFLDPGLAFSAPKYQTPRTTTPERIVCLAGQITSFYAIPSPGGYQLLGRTPIELYDPTQRDPAFRDGPVLTRVGDRHRYLPIDGDEYESLRHQVETGTYEYWIEEGEYRLHGQHTTISAASG